MNCRKFRRLIRPYLESKVDGVLGNEFRWHKHFCDGCRNVYAAAEPLATERRAGRPASDETRASITRAGGPFPGR